MRPKGSTYETLIALDERLAAHGVPRLSAWWRKLFALFYLGAALTEAFVGGVDAFVEWDAVFVGENEDAHGGSGARSSSGSPPHLF